jgi:hypothetical protein
MTNLIQKILSIFKPEPRPKYCEACGKELTIQREPCKFSAITGQPIVWIVELYCPRRAAINNCTRLVLFEDASGKEVDDPFDPAGEGER